jgi:hypothetical protein
VVLIPLMQALVLKPAMVSCSSHHGQPYRYSLDRCGQPRALRYVIASWTNLAQQNAVVTAVVLLAVASWYAVQPLGQTAGLKEKRLCGTTFAHPDGWHEVKDGSSLFDAKIDAVSVELPNAAYVAVRLVVVKIPAQFGGCTKGVLRASNAVAVAVAVKAAGDKSLAGIATRAGVIPPSKSSFTALHYHRF